LYHLFVLEDLNEAADSINTWIKEKTDGAINDIISAEDLKQQIGSGGIVLINTLHIKADWQTQFYDGASRWEHFYLAGTSRGPFVVTQLMNLTHQKFRCKRIRLIGASALEMPYVGGTMSMIFVLPERKKGFKKMEKKIKTVDLKEDFNFDDTPSITFHQVTIPNIKPVGTFRLKEPLRALGIMKAFEKDKADFGGMSDTSKDLFVSVVQQKVFLHVDEEGTTAGAATVCMNTDRGGCLIKEEPKLFICNRPFMFFIRENQSGVVLFIGRVLNPLVTG
jgi:serine protease inhibitor